MSAISNYSHSVCMPGMILIFLLIFHLLNYFSIPWIETIVVVGPPSESKKQILENVGTEI